jgi:outer membrane protein, adhesin transport system
MKLVLISALAFSLCADAFAQRPTTFTEVLTQAIKTHPALSAKRADARAASADKEAADWSMYPSPSLEASTASTGIESPPGAVLRIDQPLWTGGRITAAIDSAKSQLDVATVAVHEARWNLTLQVISSYFEALRHKARMSHAQQSVQEHEKLLAMIGRRVEQEVSSKVDQRFAESRLFQANNERSQIAQSLKSALTQLAQLGGQPLQDVVWDGTQEVTVPASLESAQDAALKVSPTLRKLQYEIELANAVIDVKRSAYKPQLLLRLERQAGANLVADSRAMLVLQAQPGAGLAAFNGVDSAVAKRESATLALESAQRDVMQRVTLDWDDYVNSRARLRDAMQASDISSDVFDSYARQYVIGRKSWIDVLNAVRETVQAQYTVDDARAQTASAAMRLRLECGLLLAND